MDADSSSFDTKSSTKDMVERDELGVPLLIFPSQLKLNMIL